MNSNRGGSNKIAQFFRDFYDKITALLGVGPPDSPTGSNKGRLNDHETPTSESPNSTFSKTEEDDQSNS